MIPYQEYTHLCINNNEQHSKFAHIIIIVIVMALLVWFKKSYVILFDFWGKSDERIRKKIVCFFYVRLYVQCICLWIRRASEGKYFGVWSYRKWNRVLYPVLEGCDCVLCDMTKIVSGSIEISIFFNK